MTSIILLFQKLITNKSYRVIIPSYVIQFQSYAKSSSLDYSRCPKLNESDIEETFVRGSGPGGQAVNKTSNCVVLRHKPTNIVIKCHIHRSLIENQKEARKILLNKLDIHFNGDQSIEAQTKLIEKKKVADKNRRQKKLQELKKKWIEREQKSDPN